METLKKVDQELNKFIARMISEHGIVVQPVYKEVYVEGSFTRMGEYRFAEATDKSKESAKKVLDEIKKKS